LLAGTEPVKSEVIKTHSGLIAAFSLITTDCTGPSERLTLIEGGHMLPLTQPHRTAQFIREAFL
jgi:hypothetical protein